MKHFRKITTSIIVAAVVAFALNAAYLWVLYHSIADDVRRDVGAAMVDMDIDELWQRAITFRPNDTIESQSLEGSLSTRNDTVVMKEHYRNGDERIINKRQLVRTEPFTNQMMTEMSSQMHKQMDGMLPMKIASADSLLRKRLEKRGIKPEFVAVEVVNGKGNILVPNPRLVKNNEDMDVFEMAYGQNGEYNYRAYMSPLMTHILHKMQGVIVTTVLLIIICITGFWYLLRTIRKMRTLEEMKDDFTNNMTHELKTPISIAYSANDALLNFDTANDQEKKKKYLQVALCQLSRLSELVETILSMSMERRKELPLNMESIDLCSFVGEIAMAQRLRKEKYIEIEVVCHEHITINADRTHLANVLNNLIDNSIKYSGESVQVKMECGEKRLIVTDNGMGIRSKSVPYIFNKFYRVPHGNRQDIRGYGIGLYYVKNILERMGFSIAVSSRWQKGTSFTIKFDKDER